jgi:dihydrofolate reductase
VRKLVESTIVSLGGVIGDPQVWGPRYLDAEHGAYAKDLLFAADALLLGRRTYQGFSAAYPQMARDARPLATTAFIDRMNAIPKFVVSRTLESAVWNATVINGDVVSAITELKRQPGQSILKYGTGPLDRLLMEHRLVDEYHVLLFPVAVPRGQRLFEDLEATEHLRLERTTTFKSGVVVLVYARI